MTLESKNYFGFDLILALMLASFILCNTIFLCVLVIISCDDVRLS